MCVEAYIQTGFTKEKLLANIWKVLKWRKQVTE